MVQQTPIKDCVAKLLALRIGSRNGISADRLARMCVINDRQLRTVITQLRDEGMPICGTPESGYFVAETPEELEATCSFLRTRALRSLQLEARMRKLPLGQLLGQMQLDLDNVPAINPKEAA